MQPAARIPFERVVWMVVIGAFVLFCSSTLAVSGGVYYFFFRSTMPMDVFVQVSRGTAGLVTADYAEQVIRDEAYAISGGPYVVSTDRQSQAVLSFYMPTSDGHRHVLASITLEHNTSITLNRAIRPRFPWSEGRYYIELEGFTGQADVYVSRGVERSFLIALQNQDGSQVRVDEAGRYTLIANENRTQLSTLEGRAVLMTADEEHNRLVASGHESIFLPERRDLSLSPSATNLLENGLFSFVLAPEEEPYNAPPMRWGCSTSYNELPDGEYRTDLWEGRAALRLRRGGGASSHGETSCWQDFGTGGVALQSYTHLELQTTFLINFQSLSDCGQDGSECPLMLLLEYTDVNGIQRNWRQGFYYWDDPNPAFASWPSRCDTCLQDHIQVNEKVWYTYETDNLFSLLPQDQRPAAVNRVRFYASGHEYDVFVGEMALLAGHVEVMPPNPQEN